MNERDQENLQDQILQLLDGDLDRVAASRLDEELRESGEARKIYVQLSALHSALGELEESRSSIGQLPVIPIERLLARQRRQSILNALLAAAAILIVCSVVLWSKWSPPQPQWQASGSHLIPLIVSAMPEEKKLPKVRCSAGDLGFS